MPDAGADFLTINPSVTSTSLVILKTFFNTVNIRCVITPCASENNFKSFSVIVSIMFFLSKIISIISNAKNSVETGWLLLFNRNSGLSCFKVKISLAVLSITIFLTCKEAIIFLSRDEGVSIFVVISKAFLTIANVSTVIFWEINPIFFISALEILPSIKFISFASTRISSRRLIVLDTKSSVEFPIITPSCGINVRVNFVLSVLVNLTKKLEKSLAWSAGVKLKNFSIVALWLATSMVCPSFPTFKLKLSYISSSVIAWGLSGDVPKSALVTLKLWLTENGTVLNDLFVPLIKIYGLSVVKVNVTVPSTVFNSFSNLNIFWISWLLDITDPKLTTFLTISTSTNDISCIPFGIKPISVGVILPSLFDKVTITLTGNSSETNGIVSPLIVCLLPGVKITLNLFPSIGPSLWTIIDPSSCTASSTPSKLNILLTIGWNEISSSLGSTGILAISSWVKDTSSRREITISFGLSKCVANSADTCVFVWPLTSTPGILGLNSNL